MHLSTRLITSVLFSLVLIKSSLNEQRVLMAVTKTNRCVDSYSLQYSVLSCKCQTYINKGVDEDFDSDYDVFRTVTISCSL